MLAYHQEPTVLQTYSPQLASPPLENQNHNQKLAAGAANDGRRYTDILSLLHLLWGNNQIKENI